jgi:hypothetical protein
VRDNVKRFSSYFTGMCQIKSELKGLQENRPVSHIILALSKSNPCFDCFLSLFAAFFSFGVWFAFFFASLLLLRSLDMAMLLVINGCCCGQKKLQPGSLCSIRGFRYNQISFAINSEHFSATRLSGVSSEGMVAQPCDLTYFS